MQRAVLAARKGDEEIKKRGSGEQDEKREDGRRSEGDLGRQREVKQKINFPEIPDAVWC